LADVLVLLATEGCIDDHFAVFKVHPHRGRLGTAVGHQGGEAAECAFLKKIFVAFRDRSGHSNLLTYILGDGIVCATQYWIPQTL
jgi:hypothetical protein